MPITTKNRTELKTYFLANSIPTEKNFAEFIDGMLNQRDDGLFKQPDNPLYIQGAGPTTGIQPVLGFVRDMSVSETPDWTLNLAARSGTSGPRSGLSINDKSGVSRLFFDSTTGNVGIGTIDPTAKLHVEGNTMIFSMAPNGGGRLVLANNRNDNRIYLEAFSSDGTTHASELLLTGHSDRPLPQITLKADQVAISNHATIGGNLTVTGAVTVNTVTSNGALNLSNSDMYFTKIDHAATGASNNTIGHAAIENSAGSYNALMIFGRTVKKTNNNPERVVKIYDDVHISRDTFIGRNVVIEGDLTVKGKINGTTVGTVTPVPPPPVSPPPVPPTQPPGPGHRQPPIGQPSDNRLKKDITPLAYGLDDLRKLLPVSFNWKDYPNPQKTLGLIAQDVEKVISEVVYNEDYASEDSYLSIAYINLIPVLINALKELDLQVQRLTAQQALG
jgi:hypothetical protein